MGYDTEVGTDAMCIRENCWSGKNWKRLGIPKDVEKPVDGRLTTGEYKYWRNKSKNE